LDGTNTPPSRPEAEEQSRRTPAHLPSPLGFLSLRSTFQVKLSGMWSEADGFVPGPHADAEEGAEGEEEEDEETMA
jgi:hypothetical protein